MRKRVEFIFIAVGFLLSTPFYYYNLNTVSSVSEQMLHSLGIAAMFGIILILIGLLNLSTKIELKIVRRNNVFNNQNESN
jgi:hypothetical protein